MASLLVSCVLGPVVCVLLIAGSLIGAGHRAMSWVSRGGACPGSGHAPGCPGRTGVMGAGHRYLYVMSAVPWGVCPGG